MRVSDHAPLVRAAREGELVCLFVLDPYFFSKERAKELPHRMQFLVSSLLSLEKNIARLGSRLFVARGRSVEVVPALAAQFKVDRVFAHRWVEPLGRERDRRVSDRLRVPFELFEGETLVPPGTVRTGAGTPFSVFTPFARAWAKHLLPPRVATIKRLPAPPADVTFDSAPIPTCEELGLTENPSLLPGGERAARGRLDHFLKQAGARYHDDRNRMDLPGTSRLSVDLKFGTLSIQEVWARSEATLEGEARRVFCNELVWREFTHHTLFDRPQLLEHPFRPDFEGFPYVTDDPGWLAWTTGKTGFPVIDASARQLLGEGFVHNRARMISASFLTKHLLIDYRKGEAHYMKWLTDGDWAQNNAGWQWSAGSGCDAQPYFRVFNPVSQSQRFDPDGAYIRRWVPELTSVPTKYIHSPWEAPEVLRALGTAYPSPIVDLSKGRTRFLNVAKQHLCG